MATATPKKKASPKAKARKAPARKTAAKKTAAKKPAAAKVAPTLTVKAQENARNVFLAGLGAYGKAFEEAQSQIESAQARMNARRAKAESLFNELVKRGEKVESEAKKAIKDIELPELKLATPEDIRKDVQTRLEKARDSFETLRGSISGKAA
ncbi:MAG: hypothetical protein AAGI24_10155 [Pseudomonadota bacterium]